MRRAILVIGVPSKPMGSRRLGEKLRREGLATDHLTVFYHTSEHDRGEPMRDVATVVILPEATNDTMALIKAARLGVAKTWTDPRERPPWRYSKAGLITVDLVPLEASQRALIGQLTASAPACTWPRWMPATLASGAARWCRRGPGSSSAAPRRRSSRYERPRYTTRMDELPVVRTA